MGTKRRGAIHTLKEMTTPEETRLGEEIKGSIELLGDLPPERFETAVAWAKDLSGLLAQWARDLGDPALDPAMRAMYVLRIEEMWAVRQNMHIDRRLSLIRDIREYLDQLITYRDAIRDEAEREHYVRAAVADTRLSLPPELSRIPEQTWRKAFDAWRGFWVTPKGRTPRYNAYRVLFEVAHKHGLTGASTPKNFARWCQLRGYDAGPPPGDTTLKGKPFPLGGLKAKSGCRLRESRFRKQDQKSGFRVSPTP